LHEESQARALLSCTKSISQSTNGSNHAPKSRLAMERWLPTLT